MAATPVQVTLAAALQDAGNALATRFESFISDLVASYGRIPVSAAVLVLAVVLGLVVVPSFVSALRSLTGTDPLDGRGGAVLSSFQGLVPTSFSELLVRTVQIAIGILAALAVVIAWGYTGVVVDLRNSIASDLQDVIGLSLTLLLIATAFIGSDLLQRVIHRFGEGADGVTDHQQEIILRIGQVVLFVSITGAILTLWSFDLTGLFVGAGFLGIIVGFAARETLGSLVSGFVLMFSRPFTIGDWVQIGEAEGTITDITMFNTRMQNIDAELLVIPNDVVGNSTIVNRSRKGRLQIRREVGVDYDSDPETAATVAAEAMEGVDDVIDSPEPRAIPVRFENSSMVFELRFWIDDPSPPRKWSAVASVIGAVKDAFDAEGIEIPFPQRTLSHRGEGNLAPPATPQRSLEDGEGDGADSGATTDGESVDSSADGEHGDGTTDGDGTADGDGTTDGETAAGSTNRDDSETVADSEDGESLTEAHGSERESDDESGESTEHSDA